MSARAAPCRYPQSHPTARDIRGELEAIAANRRRCASFYLDTVEGMSNDFLSTEGEDHHQGLARTHRLSDGSVYFFLSHSETDPALLGRPADRGSISQYRYGGPLDQEHVQQTSPLTVAPMKQLVPLDEQHPSDIVFLPEVNGLDGGYLFVTQEYVRHTVAVYRWRPGEDLELQGEIWQGFPPGGPNLLLLDLVGDDYHLGIASTNWGWGALLTARARDLFPKCAPGRLNVDALQPAAAQSMFPFPVQGASQTKLVRDATGAWYLLGFRADPTDDPNGTDYVDVYGVRFSPFSISHLLFSVHVYFRAGDTGFASTGTHYVEPTGRLLLSSSYRWAEDEGPGDSSFVSRVDECPSA
ncbi:MAG TPA: hypothetical protein VKB73_01905 [Gaiellaceae bacterium]|nr:hypothetical protein [Gaiellaceae bacterium]